MGDYFFATGPDHHAICKSIASHDLGANTVPLVLKLPVAKISEIGGITIELVGQAERLGSG